MTDAALPPPPPTPEATYKLWSYTQAALFDSKELTPDKAVGYTQDEVDRAVDDWREQYKTAQRAQGLRKAPEEDRIAFYEQRLVRTGPDGMPTLVAKTIELWAMQKAQLPWEYIEDAVDAVKLGARALPPFVVADALAEMADKEHAG